MKISVIIPIFNAERYLEKCLTSVLTQTYNLLEIILVDDGSTDNSGEIIDEYARQDSRVIALHKENGGPSSARNMGLDAATGEWIAVVDSDDYVEPDLCEYLFDKARRYHGDLVQCGAWKEFTQETGKKIFCPAQDLVRTAGVEDFGAEDWALLGNGNWGKLYRRSVIGGIRFDPRCVIGEDLQFNLRVLMSARNIVFGAEAKYHYVLTQGSIFRAKPTRKQLLNCREMLERMREETFAQAAVYQRVCDEKYRNGLDICSKIVCFRLKTETDVRQQIQRELRGRMGELLRCGRFSKSEQIKFVLIAYCWPLYCGLLLIWKRKERRYQSEE